MARGGELLEAAPAAWGPQPQQQQRQQPVRAPKPPLQQAQRLQPLRGVALALILMLLALSVPAALAAASSGNDLLLPCPAAQRLRLLRVARGWLCESRVGAGERAFAKLECCNSAGACSTGKANFTMLGSW